jgi:hypothetical protein
MKALMIVALLLALVLPAVSQTTHWKTNNCGSVGTTKDSFYVDNSLRQPGYCITIVDSRQLGATETDTLWFANGTDTAATQKVRLQPGFIANMDAVDVPWLYVWSSGGTLKYQIWARKVRPMPVTVGN